MTLLEWLQERLTNARRFANSRHGDERTGWLEDARYLEDAIEAVKERDNLRARLKALEKEYDEEVVSHDIEEKDWRQRRRKLEAELEAVKVVKVQQ